MAEQRRPMRATRRTGTALSTIFRTLLTVAAAVLLWQGEARATHAMGGELTYECIGPNQYRVYLNFYRDCNGVAAPSNCSNGRQFRVRSAQCGATLTPCFGLDGVDVVTPICLSAVDRCSSSQGQYGIQRYRYSTTINLNNWAGCGTDWIIDWDLCCRNNAITSLNNPGSRNLYLFATLNNTLNPCNNSPRYLNDPTPFACVGQTVSYNHGFNDVDGDSLSFELAPALGANGSSIPYNSGYSFTQPIITSGGANAVRIDPVTGTITFVPSIQQFSVVTVRVTEWRNGVVIGTYLRDVQFAIIACSNNNPTVSGINGTGQFTATVCAGVQLCFDVASVDPDIGQTVTMTYNNGIPGASFTIAPGSRPVGTFCWTPTAANIGPNLFSVTVRDDACALNGVNNYGFTIQVTPPLTPADAGPDQDVCGTTATMQGVLPYPQVGGQWTVVSGTGTFANAGSPTTTVSGLGAGANVFRWTVNYGTCGTTSDEVTITAFDPNQQAADAGPIQMLCTPNTTTNLQGNTAVPPALGTWTLVSGTGTIASPNDPNTQVSGLSIGQNIFRWTIDNGPCGSPTSSTVTIMVYDYALPAANAGADQFFCAPVASVTMNASPANGTWSVVTGTGTFANPDNRNTAITGLSIGANTYRWTIFNGPCDPPTTNDEITVFVFDPNSPAANAGPDQAVCTDNTTLAGNAPIFPATGQWTVVSGSGAFADASIPTTGVTGLSIGANVFQWTLSNGPCAGGLTTSQVTVTRFDPNAPAANAGPDQDLCTINGGGVANGTLAGNTPTPPSSGVWTLVSGTGTITTPGSPASTVTGMPPGTHVFRWTISNGPCGPPTSDEVTIRVFDRNAAAASAGPDQEFCAPVASVALVANAAVPPAIGTWTVVSGTGTFGDANNPTTTVTGMGIGDNVYRWTIGNGACPGATTSDDVTVRLYDPATAAADAGPDQDICGTGSITLAGNPVAFPAQGTWTLVSGTGTIVSPNNPASPVTGIVVGTSVFRWTVANGPCGTTSDEVTISRFSNTNPIANAGPDQSLCVPLAPNSVTMAGSAPIFPATGEWTLVSGGGTITNPNDPATIISGLPIGINVFRWTMDNGVCANPITSDIVRILVYDGSLPAADAGPDQQLCGPSASTIMAGSPIVVPATGQWTLVSGTGTLADPTDPNTAVSGLGVGQNIFQWTVDNGPCAAGTTTDQMSIFVYDPNNPSASAGPDQNLCTTAGNTITLNGSPVIFPATGVWTQSSGPPVTIVNPNSPTTLVIDITVSGTYTFTWTVDNGVCPNPISSNTTTVVVADGSAQPADAGPDQSLCDASTTTSLNGNTPVGVATGSWSVVQGTATFADATSPTTGVSGLSVGVNTLRWSIDNGDCGITFDDMTILVYDPNQPAADAGPDQTLCTPTTSTTLSGSPLTVPAVGQWTLVSGQGTIANPTSPTTTVSGLGLGENIFRWTVNNGVCTAPITSDDVSVFVFASNAAAANAGPDQELCTPQTSTSLAGNSAVAPGVGTWTLVSGGGTITAPNSPNSQVTGLPVGANTFQWTIDNGPCGTTSDRVTILVFDENNPDADAGPDQQLCTPANSTTLAGSPVTFPATGQWTLVSGSGTIANDADPNSAVTGLSIGENIFEWTVSNGPCANANTSDRVSVFVYFAGNPDANAGPDQFLCTPASSTTLTGSPAIFPAQGTWTLVGGQGTITSPNTPTTTVTNLGIGENVFRWTVDNGPCANGITNDVVSIFLFDDANAVADAGQDQQLCTPANSTTLAGSPVTFPAQGTWTLVSGTGTIANANDPGTLVTGLTIGANIFQWTVTNGPCGSPTSDRVSIFVFDENNPDANAGPDQELCTPLTITTLTGSPVTFPATGVWTLVGGQGTITSPNSPTTTVTNLGVGQNVFRWTVDNGPCANGTTSDEVTILLFDRNNPPANAGPDQQLCTPVTSTNLQGSAVIFPAVGTWTLVSGGGTIATPNDPNTLVTGLPIGENIFRWTLANGPCENDGGFDQVSIFVFDENNVDANAGPDQDLCTANTTSTNLAGSPVTFPARGTWTRVSGTGTIANPNDPNTLVLDLAIGTSVFRWTVDNGPCANGTTSDEVTIRVFNANDPVANAGPDQDLCTPTTSATLTGSPVTAPGTGTWTVLSGTGTVTDPNNPNTTITGLGVGTIVVQWRVDNGPCPNGTTTDVMVIRLFDQNTPVADAGPDQELCTPFDQTNLQGSPVAAPGQGIWTLVSGSGTIATPNAPNTLVTGLAVGENIFLWTVSNGPCANSLTSDLVSIFVFDENNPDADAGPDQQVCTPVTSAIMAGSPLTFPARGTWTLVSGQGTIDNANDPNTIITGLGLGVNVFRWEVYNGPCANGTTSDEVTIVLFDANAPPADAGPDQELCAPDDATTITGNTPVGAATGTWTLTQGTGIITDPSNPTTTVTGLTVGQNIFTWTIVSGLCVTTSDQVSVFVFDPANLDANAGLDQNLCMPQDSVFMAGSPVIFPARGQWTVVSGTGTPADPTDPNTLISGLTIGANVFRWEVYNGPCANGLTMDTVVITLFNDTTAAADAGPDLETCLPLTSAQLQGATPPLPARGTWTLIAGSGVPVDPNNPTTVVNGLQQGINTFVWTLDWDPCPNNGILTDTMSVYVYDPAAPLADAGPDQQLCTPADQTNLQGNTPAIPGVGTWTVAQGGGSVANVNDPNTLVTGLTVGEHIFVWTIYNGQCGFGPSSFDTVRVFVFDDGNLLADAGPDQQFCTPTSTTTLAGSPVTFPARGTWTVTTGGGTIASPNDPNTPVSNLGVGLHTFVWTVDNGACGTSTDTMTVLIFDGGSAVADAGPDEQLCTPNTGTTLTGNPPVFPATGQWTLVAGTGTIADPTNPTTGVSGLSVGTNTFRWTIDNEPCGTTQDEVTITVFDENHPLADAGPDEQLCTPNTGTTLTGNTPVFPATGQWTLVAGTGTIANPGGPGTGVSGLSVGSNVFVWTIFNGPCGTSTDTVTVVVFDGGALNAAAGPDQDFCTPITTTVSMLASSPVPPGTGTWTLVGGQGTITDPNNPFTTVTNLGLGQNVFRWTIDNGVCGSSDDLMSIYVYDHTVPPADAGPNQQLCQHETTTTELDATPTVSTGRGSWSRLTGNSTIEQPGDPRTRVTGLELGENWFVWSVDNGTCGTTTDTMLVFIKDCLTIRVPNSFSPNGDGINDRFIIPNIDYYPGSRLTVFNRWGNKVYESGTPYNNQWDGTSQFGAVFGETLPESTYYCILDLGDGSEPYTGFIYLRR